MSDDDGEMPDLEPLLVTSTNQMPPIKPATLQPQVAAPATTSQPVAVFSYDPSWLMSGNLDVPKAAELIKPFADVLESVAKQAVPSLGKETVDAGTSGALQFATQVTDQILAIVTLIKEYKSKKVDKKVSEAFEVALRKKLKELEERVTKHQATEAPLPKVAPEELSEMEEAARTVHDEAVAQASALTALMAQAKAEVAKKKDWSATEAKKEEALRTGKAKLKTTQAALRKTREEMDKLTKLIEQSAAEAKLFPSLKADSDSFEAFHADMQRQIASQTQQLATIQQLLSSKREDNAELDKAIKGLKDRVDNFKDLGSVHIDEADLEAECYICMNNVALLALKPCSHDMCAECFLKSLHSKCYKCQSYYVSFTGEIRGKAVREDNNPMGPVTDYMWQPAPGIPPERIEELMRIDAVRRKGR